MKSLFINTSDISGGAARSAFRLHNGLQNIGIDSQMFVQFKSGDNVTVIGPDSKCAKGVSLLRPTLDALPLKLYPQQNGTRFSLAYLPEGLARRCATINPDIVHLHWVADGFLRIETLRKIRKPLVWTLHDMWAFTGGCHYDEACGRYKESCGACPQLNSKKQNDLSHWVWKRKKKTWQNLNMIIVTPSRWLAKCVRSSSLFQNHRVEVIPNGLDIKRYKPANKKLVRDMLGLPEDKKLILFGAMDAVSDKRKGFQFLEPTLQNSAQNGWSDRTELLVFGESEPTHAPDFGLKARYMGRLHDGISLALLYAAADVFILPSIQDNLPNTIMESLACGTPVVAFGVGGIPEMIEHQLNGYLAKPFDTSNLAAGINWVLSNENRHKELCLKAREKAVACFDIKKVARQYAELYREVLG